MEIRMAGRSVPEGGAVRSESISRIMLGLGGHRRVWIFFFSPRISGKPLKGFKQGVV